MSNRDHDDPFSDYTPPSPPETVLPDYVTELSVPYTAPPLPPASRPPSYAPPTRPTKPIIYTFSSRSKDTMLLMPPERAADLSPVANVGVTLNLNPFTPLSYVAIVRRGGTPSGAVIGEFEIAVAHTRATVKMEGHWARLAEVLVMLAERRWRWDLGGVKLWWDCNAQMDDGSPMCICLDSERSQVAFFVPPPLDASPPLPEATLTVFPIGHEYFDHILVSALIIERKITLSF